MNGRLFDEKSSARLRCFIVDYGVVSACNLACGYCRKPATTVNRPHNPKRDISLALDALSLVTEHVDGIMFKTSGWGEITLVPDYLRLFRHAKSLGYPVLQLITNGVRMPEGETLSKLKDLGDFSLQLSLDGITLAANVHRFGNNAELLDRVINSLGRVLERRIPVEVNSVLTSANTDRIVDLLKLLVSLSDRYDVPIMWMPRPLQLHRVCDEKVQPASPQSVDDLEALILGGFLQYEKVLPPKRYLEGLMSFLRTGKRPWKAYDTIARLSVGARGTIILPGNDRKLGTLLDSDVGRVFAERARFRGVVGDLDFGPKLTQFEIHSLFLGGEIPWEEMVKVPSCRSPEARSRLEELRREVIGATALDPVGDNPREPGGKI